MQLLMGMSMRRYFPAMGTAGFERNLVNGCRRDPRPPPIMTPRTSFIDGMVVLHIVMIYRAERSRSVPLISNFPVIEEIASGYRPRNDMQRYYLLILKSCRIFLEIKRKGYANTINTSITAKIRYSLIHHLQTKCEAIATIFILWCRIA